jgi:hypothetical protein
MEWKEAIEYAKEELGVYGYVDPSLWEDVVDIAKEILHEEYSDQVLSRYNNHMESRDWFLLRKSILKRDNNKCSDCGDVATTVHHLSYNNMKTIYEKNDCISLCNRCHFSRHNSGYPYRNSKIWISKSEAKYHTVYYCNSCECQRTFTSTDNPIIFKCDHCGKQKIYLISKGDFE